MGSVETYVTTVEIRKFKIRNRIYSLTSTRSITSNKMEATQQEPENFAIVRTVKNFMKQ